MGFFHVSQVEDKKWMSNHLLDLPRWREVESFDRAQVARYNAALAARLDEIGERAASLHFARNATWAKLRNHIDNEARAYYSKVRCHGGNMGIVPRLIEAYIPDTRRSARGVAVLLAAALLYAGLVLAGAVAGWALLLWLLLGVPIALAIASPALHWLLIWASNRAIERRARGVWGLISGPRDYLTLDRSEALEILSERWRVRGAKQLIDRLEHFIDRHGEEPAYYLTMVVALARLGCAAEYLTRRETITYSFRSLKYIRRHFGSWDELGQALDRSWRVRIKNGGEPHELERVSQNIDYLRRHVWPELP